jgi:hypothetical protein
MFHPIILKPKNLAFGDGSANGDNTRDMVRGLHDEIMNRGARVA